MRSFFDWFAEKRFSPDDPWLILGKGPSFSKRADFDLPSFHSVGLNHVCREQKVTVAHMIDLDVVDACHEALMTNADVLVMPWIPHTKNDPLIPLLQYETKLSDRNLAELAVEHPVLRRLESEGRLLFYNLSTARQRQGDSPVIKVQYFSVEAALNLLAACGVRSVRSLGIDGGASYSTAFDDLKTKTLLANKRASFDKQFGEIAKTISTTGIDYAPLDVESPIRVYVATTEAQMLATKVLEYSIKKHASMTTVVVPLHQSGITAPEPKRYENRPRTPFSFQRFMIPEAAGYRGRAIYLDSDMQVFRDIRELWTLSFDGANLLAAREPEETGRKPQFSVMLLDCGKLHWNVREIVNSLDAGTCTYQTLMETMPIANVRAAIDSSWNSLERYKEGETSLIHYTDMDTQPWVSTVNPNGYLWVRDLIEMIDRGLLPISYVERHVQEGWARPSLLYQIEHRLEDPLRLPREARALDDSFAAPFESIDSRGAGAWTHSKNRIRAVMRHYYQESGLLRLERKIRNRLLKD